MAPDREELLIFSLLVWLFSTFLDNFQGNNLISMFQVSAAPVVIAGSALLLVT